MEQFKILSCSLCIPWLKINLWLSLTSAQVSLSFFSVCSVAPW